MLQRLKNLTAAVRHAFRRAADDVDVDAARSLRRVLPPLLAVTAVTAAGYGLVTHPPL